MHFLLDEHNLDALFNTADNWLVIAPMSMFDKNNLIETVTLKKGQLSFIYTDALFKGLGRPPEMRDFMAKNFYCLDSSAASVSYQKNTQHRLAEFGISSKTRELHSMDSIMNNILYGNGYTAVGILDDQYSDLPDIKNYPLPTFTYLCAAYRKDSSGVIKSLAQHLKKTVT